jgi:pSer/pThr/pTyr-binding forkhead associated (FHA) protein
MAGESQEPRILPGQLVVVGGREVGVVYSVGTDDMVIGRGAKSEIQVEGDGVSRAHARLSRDLRGAVTVLDLGSANGTYVNDKRVDFVVLQTGDRVRVGREVEFEFRYELPDERETLDLGKNKAAASVESNLAAAMRNLGRMHLSAREYRQALRAFERARKQIEQRRQPDPREVAAVLLEICECWLGLVKPVEAARVAEEAVALLGEANASDAELGPARFALARALPEQDADKARELANRALYSVERDGALAGKIRVWLARR